MVGVDIDATDVVKERVDRFVAADLDQGLPPDLADEAFDVVVAADVFEHLRDPQHVLDEIHGVLADDAIVVVTIPNFAHWYPRARVAIGRFDYDRRGILDRGHVRFFTRRSFVRLARESGYDVVESRALGIPFEVVDRGASRQGGGVTRRLAATHRPRRSRGVADAVRLSVALRHASPPAQASSRRHRAASFARRGVIVPEKPEALPNANSSLPAL